MTRPRAQLPLRLAHVPWGVVAAILFLIHATCFLYFFVDDEGITLVYARNLVSGNGLVYAPSDGPSEGYSNFLHLFVMAGMLVLVNAAGVSPMWTFVAGGAVSLACGAALVTLVWRLGGCLGLPAVPRAVAALVLALSGPLAVWSNSSLETVPFALAFMTLIAATLSAPDRPIVVVAADDGRTATALRRNGRRVDVRVPVRGAAARANGLAVRLRTHVDGRAPPAPLTSGRVARSWLVDRQRGAFHHRVREGSTQARILADPVNRSGAAVRRILRGTAGAAAAGHPGD